MSAGRCDVTTSQPRDLSPGPERPSVWILYQLAYGLLLFAAGPVLLLRRGGHYLESLPRRLTLHRSDTVDDPLWIHAVSVGEVGVAATLASRLAGTPLLITTITPTGQERARALLDDHTAVDYLPFDLALPVRRFLRHHAPRALVLAEGDYWPLLLHNVKQQGLPVVVVNARVGDRSFARMRRLRRWLGPMLGGVDSFGVQTAEDRRRLIALGVRQERVTITGNLKFEAPEPEFRPELESDLLAAAGERPILVAGSTMAGEEPLVLAAFSQAGGGEKAMLLLAPRHPERWDDVARLVTDRGESLSRRSALEPHRKPSIVLLDSMGELASIYRLASAAFIGGTLVSTGGHNPLEPARFGVAVATGPSMENFRAMAEQFDLVGAWRRVFTAADLGRIWRLWLDEPGEAAKVGQAAADLVASNQGALDRTLALLQEMTSTLARPSESGDDH